MLHRLFATMAVLALAAGCAGAPGDDPSADATSELSKAAAHRFDVVTFQCGGGRSACPPDDDKCLCPAEFGALNYRAHRHYVAMPSDAHRPAVLAHDNFMTAYENDLNGAYADGKSGEQGADALAAKLDAAFAKLPSYVLLNEISKGRWQSSMHYRQYVVDFVRRLRQMHGVAPIVASPFGLPARFTDGKSWKYVAKWAFVAAEVQLTGREVKASGFSVAAARRVYRQSIDSYAAVGVSKSRLLILDNFSNTKAGATFGRAGVSRADWLRAIKVRAQAAGPLGAVGYVSYAWGGNAMHDTSANRIAYMRAYAREVLP